MNTTEPQSPPSPALRTITYLDAGNEREFTRLKRRKWPAWTFLVKGEWDQDMYHGGTTTFDASGPVACRGGYLYALMVRGFPSRIAAVAESMEQVRLEVAAGAMMMALEDAGGEYVEGVIRWGWGIDVELLRQSM
jgi:hypothetical protein